MSDSFLTAQPTLTSASSLRNACYIEIGISPNQPLPYTTLEPRVKKIGAITGFQQVTRPASEIALL
ncbi:hypothetical protein C8Q69DRAFT_472688 [Paecilomyces variotii]|uniref:Uncharacterized protein n=1 Tax=Byssochlamys spectabilis TaxID=264951 RepID=A0A443HQP5_BYSSP|nr:hypothetical protein C8Q69DRAFT_472688 [Paecilomyces variotii]RWQ94104.1 hypothetical protein C8Q69DRAFT_472688 [Paecilomyces variotii]